MPCHARLALTRLGGDPEAGANRKIGRKSELGSYGRGPEVKETRDRVCGGGVLIRAVDHGRDESALVLLGGRAANREFYPDVWDVPGGHIEPGETGEQALVRELREEIGVMPTAWVSLGEFCEPHPGGEGSMALHLYAVTSWEGAPRTLRSTPRSGGLPWRTLTTSRSPIHPTRRSGAGRLRWCPVPGGGAVPR
jgi:mutator protein MutT